MFPTMRLTAFLSFFTDFLHLLKVESEKLMPNARSAARRSRLEMWPPLESNQALDPDHAG
ncbi:hypothetical protein H4W32_008502 [Actinophytocola algeriensis]|uniref:Uncharacterized protein n=1 Tax=Actinophytocola algeriensis TaxID=1768010 RepID=A0A7W7QBF0_9PSEU|nr:hypothetical protein [Actinophytocola algeriensis]MBE1480460.1 hypothetical protein [Actinophytocola algeriensis]